jgi:hypothetical protein
MGRHQINESIHFSPRDESMFCLDERVPRAANVYTFPVPRGD